MSEGSSRLSPATLKRKKLDKRYQNITTNKEIMSEREIVQGVFEALDEHKKVLRSLKLRMKDIENRMGIEGNAKLLEMINRAVRRDMRVLRNLKIMSSERMKELKKMKKMKKMIKLKVVEEDKKNEGSSGENEGEEGEIDDNAPWLCADLKEDDGGAKGVDGEDDEYSTDTENAALRMKEFIKEDDYTYCPPGEDKVNYRKWVRYYKQIRDSEGFDIDDYPGHSVNAQIVPLPLQNLEENSRIRSNRIQLATYALNGYNLEKETSYEFHKLIRVNSQLVGGVIYFITFEATNPDAAYAMETFQTKIFCTGPPGMRVTKVLFCRQKNPSHGVVA